MEIEYNKLKKLIDNTEIFYFEKLVYKDVNYLIFPSLASAHENNIKLTPAFFIASDIAHWDIYISIDLINERFIRPVLFHEVLEAERFSCFLKRGNDSDESRLIARTIASKYDNRYARESLSLIDYCEYKEFKKEWKILSKKILKK